VVKADGIRATKLVVNQGEFNVVIVQMLSNPLPGFHSLFTTRAASTTCQTPIETAAAKGVVAGARDSGRKAAAAGAQVSFFNPSFSLYDYCLQV
jgi:hypothetical protein